jgi:hypothetical protein
MFWGGLTLNGRTELFCRIFENTIHLEMHLPKFYIFGQIQIVYLESLPIIFGTQNKIISPYNGLWLARKDVINTT